MIAVIKLIMAESAAKPSSDVEDLSSSSEDEHIGISDSGEFIL